MESEHQIRLTDGRTLTCLVIGDSEHSPVFYFHGFPGSRFEGRLAACAARRLDLLLIAPDRPGIGKSTFQPNRTISSWTADVVELADHFRLDQFTVVGVSGGGPFALACAAHIPERLSGVALVGAIGPIENKGVTQGMVRANRVILSLARHSYRFMYLVFGLAVPYIRTHPEFYIAAVARTAPPADRRILEEAAYRRLFVESTVEALRQGGRGIALELRLLARPWDFELQNIRAPVHVWQGLADRIVPAAMARYLAASMPESEVHFLPDEGHLSLIVNQLGTAIAELCR